MDMINAAESSVPAPQTRPETIVTTSWDDGHRLDSRLAELLSTFGVPATFYISPENTEIPAGSRLPHGEIKRLAEGFEIGSHTNSHPRLTHISDAEAMHEIALGKESLEQIIGNSVDSFCYPGGVYKQRHIRMVHSAGFTMARTVRRGCTTISPRYEVSTTLHAYRHLVDIPRAASLGRKHGITGCISMYTNWDDAAIALFHQTLVTGGIYHLWGHSWEIDRNDDWRRLERVLRVIGGRGDVRYVENRKLPFTTGS
jgi:peptidoglycan/xylan/chitin deacetylase (PgdA/CDA1 family)